MSVGVELAGVELFGYHGVDEDERRDGQLFLFDVWLDVPVTASESDRIEDAVDYREVLAVVREVSDARAFALLEALAAAVADALLRRFPAERVRVRVRKPEVRLDAPVDYSAVTVELSAPGGAPPRRDT
jgi:7,8-dihydroneopterin aldolase/epimerase/oxygenase